jgi:asparagine N-glycosylation enzyme membrane subunit Stt3
MASALVPLALLGALLALCGGLENARELLRLTPEAWRPDDYIREYQTGGPGYYVTGLRLLQPVPWALGVLAALLAVLRPRALTGLAASPHRTTALRLLGGYVLVFLAVSCAYSSKNMRFLSPLYAPVALLAAAFVVRVFAVLRARLPAAAWRTAVAAVAVVLVLSAWADARRFDHYFNEIQIQDLATPWFTKADAGKL